MLKILPCNLGCFFPRTCVTDITFTFPGTREKNKENMFKMILDTAVVLGALRMSINLIRLDFPHENIKTTFVEFV